MSTGVSSVAIDDISVPRGRRTLRGIVELAASIAEIGLLHPITVSADNTLIAGYHRLEACRQLGWTEIPAAVAGNSELVEIDENLIRNDLNVIERGEHFVRREQWLVDHGLRAPAFRPEKALTVSGLQTTAGMAAEIGMSESGLRQHKQIATKIDPAVRDLLRVLPVATHTRDLLEIARAKPAEQQAIAAVLERGIVESVRDAKQVVRDQTHAARDAALPAPPLATVGGPFDLLCADPPWRYDRGTVRDGGDAIENHYPTMDLDAIRNLPVSEIADPDCVLFLWVTSPKLAEALEVITAWGFKYRTCAVWVKDKIGLGYYFRQRHELLLVATKGTPGTPAPADRTDSVITAPRLEHSAKPEQVYGLIEAMYPRARKAELFARNQRPGWVAWGNQA